jgi:hypothetical protein
MNKEALRSIIIFVMVLAGFAVTKAISEKIIQTLQILVK